MFATRLIRSLKLMVAVLFLYVTTHTIRISGSGPANGVESWIFAVFMIVPMLVLPVYLLFARNKN